MSLPSPTPEKVRGEAESSPAKSRTNLPAMLGILIALAVVAVVVWANRGVPDGVQPPPVLPRPSAQLEKEITALKANKDMPQSQKDRAMGFMQMQLQQSKDWEAKQRK